MLRTLRVTLIGSALGGSLTQMLLASAALANPLSATVTTGSASVASSLSKTQIDQKSEDVVIDWSSFNIGAGQTTEFVQPNAQAIAVNRIGGNSASQVLGTLDANGRIVLINGNGMLFGKGSQVNVGSLVATSTGSSDSDVLAGKFTQAGNQNAAVVNQGSIRTSQGGLVALVAPSVTNAGTVNAKFGIVAVGAANKFTVDFSGDGLVSFATQGDVNGKASAINTGALTGANVSLTANAAEGLATGVVTMSGIVLAQTAKNVGGTITLDAGDGGNVTVSNAKLDAAGRNGGGTIQIGGWNENAATIDKASVLNASASQAGNGGSISVISGNTNFQGGALAQGGATGGNGGTIETSGHNLNFTGARVDAGAAHGRDGSWLLDPYDLTVDGAAAATIDAALALNTNVTLQTTATGTSGPGIANPSGNGDIIIDSPIEWSTAATLSLSAYRDIDINTDIAVSGGGALSMTTGTGTTGDYLIASGDNISFTGGSSSGASLAINGSPYTLLYSMSDVQNINNNLSGSYALANSLDASSVANWGSLGAGDGDNGFRGVFTGLGNTISNLTITTPYDGGFFVSSCGTIRNIGMVGGSVTGNDDVGGLVAYMFGGTIEYAYATGAVSGGSAGEIGGLVGNAVGGLIKDSYATGAVSGSWDVGGLVGFAQGLQGITNSHASGAVYGNGYNVGGLVGRSSVNGPIANDYATGSVTGLGNYVGGLIGQDMSNYNYPGGVSFSYATGAVSGYLYVGGLIGFTTATQISSSHATGAVSGASAVGGLVGEMTMNTWGGLNFYGSINQSYATGAVSGKYQYAGGLVGWDDADKADIDDAYATGTVGGGDDVGGLIGWASGQITDSYATGAVAGLGYVGGFAGYSRAKINDASASGAVTGEEYVGGLVGLGSSGEITNSYSTGAVVGETDVGGFIGDNNSKHISSSAWDVQTSGQASGIGGGTTSAAQVTGATTAELQDGSFFAGNEWGQAAGLFPYFLWQYPTGTPQAISGVAYKDDGETPLASTSSGIGYVSLMLNGENLGSISTGANGYYYLLLAPGTISDSAVLAYTTQNSATGATNAAILENATGTLSDFNIWGNIFIAPTADATYSAASATSLQTQDAALIAQAAGSNTSVQTLVDGLDNYGYIATGSGFTFDEAVNLSDGLFVQTTAADADITIDDAVKLANSAKLRLIATGNIDIDDSIKTAGTVSLTAGGSIMENGSGSIAAATLTGSSAGGATFNGANLVGTFDNFTNAGAGGISLTDRESLIVGANVDSGTGNLSFATKGAGHNIEITGALTAGDKIGLNSSGSIGQSGAGAITAMKLAGRAAGATTLNGANHIGSLGDFTNTGGNFALTDKESLTISGTLNTGSHNQTLQVTAGNIDLTGALDGNTVTLGSATGEVFGAGTITADLLNVTANTGIDLTGANDIGTIGTNQTNSGPDVINNP